MPKILMISYGKTAPRPNCRQPWWRCSYVKVPFMTDLFGTHSDVSPSGPRPLAERLRPKSMAEVIGQRQILDPDAPLGTMLSSGVLSSLIFWGPPGVGKTTLARLLADHTDLHFEQISAIFSGVADLKKVFEAAKLRHKMGVERFCLSMRFTGLTKRNKTAFCPIWRMVHFCWWGPPPKTRPLN